MLSRQQPQSTTEQTDPFMKAAVYALKRKDALRVFLSNAGIAMDTNHEERTLRVIPMGRRNYLFYWPNSELACYLQATWNQSVYISGRRDRE